MAHETPVQPLLAEMLRRYLQKRTEGCQAGIADGGVVGEVVPFEAAPVQPVEPRLAWDESLSPGRHFQPDLDATALEVPPDWPMLVSSHEPEMGLAFALGNFPQMVRDLQGLMRAGDLSTLRPATGRPTESQSLLDWATQTLKEKRYPQALLALGALRLAKQFDAAQKLMKKHEAHVPPTWLAAWANEQAALLWHRGQVQEAAKLWNAQPASTPVLFNRGMSALFLGRPVEARTALAQAAEQLPEDSAWHHLARLYIALAEMRM